MRLSLVRLRCVPAVVCLMASAFAAPEKKTAPKPAAKAAPKTPAPDRWPVQSLTVEGNQNYTAEQVLAVAGLKKGQLAGKREFEEARDRLVASGAFETVGYKFAPSGDGNGFAASFQVVEVQAIYPVRFEEMPFAEDKAKAQLKAVDPLFGPKIPGTKEVLSRYTQRLQELTPEKLTAVVRPSGKDQYEIVFRPARTAPVVAEITFEGNDAMSTQALQKAISGVAVGVPYTETRFRELLDTAVRPRYDALGRVRVAFAKIATEEAKDVKGLIVHVKVDEGPVFTLEEVDLEGNTAVSAKDLMKAAAFKPGEPVNFDDIAESTGRIEKALRHQGHMRVSTNLERKIDDRKKTVSLMIHITEGPRFTFGKLNIEGLDIHGEVAIKKAWAMKEGKPFNADYPNFFLDRIREEGLFDNLGKTSAKVDIDEQALTADVTLRFGAGEPAPEDRFRPRRGRR